MHDAALKGANNHSFAISRLLCPALQVFSYPEYKTQDQLVLGSRTLGWELEDLCFCFTEKYF